MKNNIQTDVLVIGAGAAGIGAAVGATEAGAQVCVLEKLSYPGGRATASAVGTICGLYFRGSAPCFAMIGFPRNFADKIILDYNAGPVRFSENLWFIPCHPKHFESTAKFYLKGNGIQTFFNSTILDIKLHAEKVTEVIVKSSGQEITFQTKAIIDCSGDGVTMNFTQHPIIGHGEKQQASAIVFCVDDISISEEFALQLILIKHITQNIQVGNIPEEYNLLSIIPASLRNNSVLIKLGIPWNTIKDSDQLQEKAKKLVKDVFSFLKTNVPSFEQSTLSWIAEEVGQRSGLRPICRDVLTAEHVHSCVKTTDSICNAVWPIEFWEIGNKRVEMTYFPENDYYSIPAGCLISTKIKNLFFAGKLISSTEKAIASARVIGTCLATGYSAGILAAYQSQNKKESEAINFIQSQMLN